MGLISRVSSRTYRERKQLKLATCAIVSGLSGINREKTRDIQS